MTIIGVRGGCVLLLGLGAILGCGESEGDPTVVVTGTVTQKGAPVAGAAVSFIHSAANGQSAFGITDAAGKYSLTTRTKDDGALPGQYKVTIAKYDGPTETAGGGAAPTSDGNLPASYTGEAAAAPPPTNLLPAKYASPDSSGFSAAVSAGAPNSHNFDLEE